MATADPTVLRFLWWNAQDFAHYDKSRREANRWPATARAFDEKLRRVGAVLHAGERHLGGLELIGLCEVTRRAAERLRDEFFDGYRVVGGGGDEASFEALWLAAPGLPVQVQPPILAPDLPRHTRAMAVLDLLIRQSRIRFVACHWPPFEEARRNRERIAEHLNHDLYDFLVAQVEAGMTRHAVVLGDLNDEPFSTPRTHLHADRARGAARRPLVYQDHDVRRVRLYNCAWRLLGEQRPHGVVFAPDQIDAAGTWYSEERDAWATLDHVIVSAGLLAEATPRLDEASVQALTSRACTPSGDVPGKFTVSGGIFRGVSDHLPLLGRILLH